MGYVIIILYAAVAVWLAVYTCLAFSGRGVTFMLGKEGSEKRELFDERKVMRFKGWLGLVSVILFTAFSIGFFNRQTQLPFFAAWFAVYFVFSSGNGYLMESKRFRKDPNLPIIKKKDEDMTEKELNRYGFGLVTFYILFPFALFALILFTS
jgi:hypothetical protein